MNDRKRQLESIFHDASELATPEERASFLDKACGDDAALRDEVEGLLSASGVGEGLFKPVETGTVRFRKDVPELESECAGARIGRYKLLERIGEGGMGVVYMAEQEEPVRRKVALKIIKLGMDTHQVVARFEAERQALAMMDHPNIARVLDGGATEAGRPFFVMELVQGVPITEFCETNNLSIHQRLELFIPVCQAIQSAHQKGIIHRDIKPSNVLVTMHEGRPHPMVIDFGVAKAIGQKLTEKTLFTHFATMIGTPAYMSPEQAEMSKLDVDTRADVYSMGVLLYELLTGTAPFPEERLRQAGYGEMQRIIAEEEPERPSTRLKKAAPTAGTHRQVPRPSALASDLDWIVMKCLEKDRSRRYETINGLADDIQRHLVDEPVMARPPSAAYRFRKLVRRHKLRFTAGAFAVAVLLLAAAVSSWQAVKALRAERAAQEQTRNAEAIKDFLVRQVLAVNPFVEPQTDPGKRAMVDRVARAVEAEFADQPKVRAELHFALAQAFAGLGNFGEMTAQCEQAFEIRRKVLGPQHSDTLWALAAAAQGYQRLGRRAEGVRAMADALADIRRSPHELSSGEAEVLWTYYDLQSGVLPSEEVLANLKEALAVSKRLLPPRDHKLQNKIQYLTYLTAQAGRLEEAEAMMTEGIRDCERLHGANSPLSAQFRKFQASYLMQRDRWGEAKVILERIVPVFHASIGTNHIQVLDTEGLLAEVYEHEGRLTEAANLNKSLHPRLAKHVPDWRARNYSVRIARFFARQRNYAEAKAAYAPLRRSWESHPPESIQQFLDFVETVAATEGWPAAAEILKARPEAFADSLWLNLNKAWVFRYIGDEHAYRSLVHTVLGSTNRIGANEEHLPIEIAALGSVELSPAEVRNLETRMRAFEAALPERDNTTQTRGYRAIGQMLLQLGRAEECLQALEKSAARQPTPDPYLLFLKAMCLQRLARDNEARAVFAEANGAVTRLLPEPLEGAEGFLQPYQLYQYLLIRREAQALLGLP